MHLLLARHGQSLWQVVGDEVGGDSPLTRLGELQAHRLGEYLARHYRVDAVIASDLKRARRTAEIAAAYLGLEVTLEPDFREFDDWARGWVPSPVSMWETQPAHEVPAGYYNFRERLRRALRRVLTPHGEESTILIVAHGGTIGTILRILFDSDTLSLRLWNAALHHVEWFHSQWRTAWRLHAYNNMEYLPHFMRTV